MLHATSITKETPLPSAKLNRSSIENVIPSNHDELRPPVPLCEEDDDPSTKKPHPDERQVGLDTDRSFVMYPVG